MQFMPGTQRAIYFDESKGMHYDLGRVNKMVKQEIRRGFYGYDWREIRKDPNWEPDESKAVTMPCQAGQFLILSVDVAAHLSTSRWENKEMRVPCCCYVANSSDRLRTPEGIEHGSGVGW